jgi:predicted phosphodiesterase
MRSGVRIVALSDTHCMHERIAVPPGDVLVHAGDFCLSGKVIQAKEFAAWFAAQPHAEKVVIAGNHDRCLEADPTLGPALFEGCHYLFDSAVDVAGLTFYGAPWQPWFLDWAFNLPRGEALRAKWDLIPRGVDVLVTHGPPYGVLDRVMDGTPVGCEELAKAIARVEPRVHVFGHIHEGYGAQLVGNTLYANASNCTFAYDPINPPIVIDIPPDGEATVTTG